METVSSSESSEAKTGTADPRVRPKTRLMTPSLERKVLIKKGEKKFEHYRRRRSRLILTHLPPFPRQVFPGGVRRRGIWTVRSGEKIGSLSVYEEAIVRRPLRHLHSGYPHHPSG